MKRKLVSSGYTIVEVMIVLAVSGLLLITVMASISGEQAKTEFTAAMRDFESRIQDVLNDTATGTFVPAASGCTVTPGASGGPVVGGAAADQGTNQDCVFVGKAIQFRPTGAGNEGKFDIYTIVGRREIGTGAAAREVKDIQQASPRILYSGDAQKEGTTLNSGLQFKKVLVGGSETYGIALVSSFGQTSTIGGIVSGSSGTTLLQMPGLAAGANVDDLKSKVAALNPTDAVRESIIICLGDADSGGRIGAVKISGNGTELLFDFDAKEACSL